MQTASARIVMTSLTQNVGRLMVTMLLSLIFTWIFAVTGWLYFQQFHVSEAVLNADGPCANLLTCFVAYSHAGLMQLGLAEWVTALQLPLETKDMARLEFAKVMWQLAFGLISMFVVSIITGIICGAIHYLSQLPNSCFS